MPTITEVAVVKEAHLHNHELRIEFLKALPEGIQTPKDAKGTLVLFHGFPQSSYQFRKVVQPIADQTGYLVIAPSLRGDGFSSKPLGGPEEFTKTLMAEDARHIVFEHLKMGDKPVHILGHDIGAMVAVRYAMLYPDTASLIFGEAPIPGTKVYYDGFASRGGHLWHFHFHSCPHLPESLVKDREKEYLSWFFNQYSFRNGVNKEDLDYYAHQFAILGTARCQFNAYRAFFIDEKENEQWKKEHGKLKMPTTLLSGERCFLAQVADAMGQELCENYTTAVVADSGHWLTEENPESFIEQVVIHMKKHA